MKFSKLPLLLAGLLTGCSLFVILQRPDTDVVITSPITVVVNATNSSYLSSLVGGALFYFQDGTAQYFWLLDRESRFRVNIPQKSAQVSIEITAGIDSCGRQSLIEFSFAGSPPLELGGESKSAIIHLEEPSIYVRSMGPVCLIAEDPTANFGQLIIKPNTGLVPIVIP